MVSQLEICLNIWFVVDSSSQLIYRAAARAYSIAGSDDDKNRILRSMADSDFHLSKHFSLSRYRTSVVDAKGNKEELSGFFVNNIDSLLPDILEMICKGLEADFIEQPIVTSEGAKIYRI